MGVEYTFRYCPAGTFAMGSPKNEKGRLDDETQREVTLTNGFWMMETEVTQAMWEAAMGTKPNAYSPVALWNCFVRGVSASMSAPEWTLDSLRDNFVRGADSSDLPMCDVSWRDCQNFIARLNASGYAPKGWKFRLPTEAEWEYACRAGATTPFSWGTSLNGDKANCDGTRPYGTSTKGEFLGRTTEVGSYAPNAWGLRDMHGNVREWCSDWYGSDYGDWDQTDPTGPSSRWNRVLRGGSWRDGAKYCRSACRFDVDPTTWRGNDVYGVRLVLGLALPEEGARAWSESYEAGTAKSLNIKGVKYTFRYCPAGTFTMGSPESEEKRDDDETQREVTLTKGFWLLETEVTQAMWESATGENPSAFSSGGSHSSDVIGTDTSNFPADSVSWYDCQGFIEKLNASGCAPEGLVFRLPTEAEWEYACRAGTTTPFSWGTSLNGDKANCDGTWPYGTSTKGEYLDRTTEVGSYAPNPWGLYDMHGNVCEWCSDWYDDYVESDQTDPTGPSSGESRVTRGGSSGSSAASCRSAARSYEDPTEVDDGVGFRLVLGRVLPEEPSPASSQDSEASETPVEILPTTSEDED